MDKALVPTTGSTDIEGFGSNQQVVEFAKRLARSIPGGKKLTPAELMALAQVSIATRLNPYIGEVWYIPEAGPMIGIKGLRRMANEQTNEASNGKDYWHGSVTPVDPITAGCPADQAKQCVAAFMYELRDTATTRAWTENFKLLAETYRDAGHPDPVGEARKDLGPNPKWVGYGYSLTSDRTKMNKTRAAEKRAEADALKKRFHIPFGVGVSTYEALDDAEQDDFGADANVIEGLLSEKSEDDNQVEDVHGKWAVHFAAEQWNCTAEDAAKQLWKAFPQATRLPKAELKKKITGDPTE